jgi:hypothetical protein
LLYIKFLVSWHLQRKLFLWKGCYPVSITLPSLFRQEMNYLYVLHMKLQPTTAIILDACALLRSALGLPYLPKFPVWLVQQWLRWLADLRQIHYRILCSIVISNAPQSHFIVQHTTMEIAECHDWMWYRFLPGWFWKDNSYSYLMVFP